MVLVSVGFIYFNNCSLLLLISMHNPSPLTTIVSSVRYNVSMQNKKELFSSLYVDDTNYKTVDNSRTLVTIETLFKLAIFM